MGLWLFLNERCGRREWIWPCWGGGRRCCPWWDPRVHMGLLAPRPCVPRQLLPARSSQLEQDDSRVYKFLEMEFLSLEILWRTFSPAERRGGMNTGLTPVGRIILWGWGLIPVAAAACPDSLSCPCPQPVSHGLPQLPAGAHQLPCLEQGPHP